jgi:hypothetical protein
MDEIILHLLDQPIANLIVLGGLVFLFVAAVGKISGKIEPDTRGRIVCGVLGLVLLVSGLLFHGSQDSKSAQTLPQASQSATQSQTPSTASSKQHMCRAGYVARLAVPDDHICVTQETRNQVAVDNQLSPSRTKNGGPYGADTCIEGFVWREAVPADHICVTVDSRRQTAEDNAQAASRVNP